MYQLCRRSFYICVFAAFFAGGCAKQEIVKKDELIPPAAPAKPVVAAKPVAKETGVKEQSVKETQIKDQAAKDSAADAKSDGSVQSSLEKVFFDFDSYELSPAARDTLAKNAGLVKQNATAKVSIEGHCDERGSDEYNLALGEKRARAAMKYLETMGIPSNGLSTISYGKEKPADPGHNEAAWAKNRRDEFIIITK